MVDAIVIGAGPNGLAAAMAPTQSPEKVAQALVSLIERPRRELYVPRYAMLGVAFDRLLPNVVERAVFELVREWHFGFASQPPTHGNLFEPRPDPSRVHGARPARASLARMLAWGAARVVKRLTRPGRGSASLRPHAA